MPSAISTTVARSDGSLTPLGQRTWTIAFGSSEPAENTPRDRPV